MNEKNPLVLCVTNVVASNFTANCLLAIGAKPAMIEEPCEAEDLARVADAALINVGTVTAAQTETMRAAIRALNTAHVPWVLDPVAVQLLSFRRKLVDEFLACQPTLVRGNHAEIDALGALPCVALATGEKDAIIPSPQLQPLTSTSFSGGTPMLQDVTATGCAQGAICAAFLGRGFTPFKAAASASSLMKRAGERAYARAKTPGSFRIALVDALWELTHD